MTMLQIPELSEPESGASAMLAPERFLDCGEAALVVEFGNAVDPAINERVLALDAALRDDPPEGTCEFVPTYRSLMIHYDPLRIAREDLVACVEKAAASTSARGRSGAEWLLPCCYEPGFGEDIAAVAEMTRLPADKVAALHAQSSYRLYMYGFAPGFAYLGSPPEAIAVSRRPQPRAAHPPGAVMLGGGLCAIGTFPMPTGWYVVGRTPERLYAPERTPPFLIPVGDTLRFEPIDAATFGELERRTASGELVARRRSA
jgi:inhibitor of KinA